MKDKPNVEMGESYPFSTAANPLMTMIAFLASFVDTRGDLNRHDPVRFLYLSYYFNVFIVIVAAAAAQAAMDVLSGQKTQEQQKPEAMETDSGIQTRVVTTDCFICLVP